MSAHKEPGSKPIQTPARCCDWGKEEESWRLWDLAGSEQRRQWGEAMQGASICRFKRLHPITSQKHQRTGAPAQRTRGKRTRRLGPNILECFCYGRSTGPHCRPIIANLTILFWMFHHYCDTLEWFLYILFCMFETLLVVVWKQWNISKCSDQRIVKFVLYEWNIFKKIWQMFWNIVNVPTIIADVDLLVDIRWF